MSRDPARAAPEVDKRGTALLVSSAMTLGLSLASFHGFTLEEALAAYGRLAAAERLSAVELNLQVRPGPDRVWPGARAGAWPEEALRGFLRPFSVRGVHLPFIDLCPVSRNEGIRRESRRQLEDALDLAVRLEMTYAVLHAPGAGVRLPWDEERAVWIEFFGTLLERASQGGVTLCIENGERLLHLGRLMDVAGPLADRGARICIDTGHAYARIPDRRGFLSRLLPRLDRRWRGSFRIPALMPFEPWGSLRGFLEAHQGLVHHFHLHDRRGMRDHLGLGEGDLDLRAIAPFLRTRPVILEIPKTSEAELGEEIRKAKALLGE